MSYQVDNDNENWKENRRVPRGQGIVTFCRGTETGTGLIMMKVGSLTRPESRWRWAMGDGEPKERRDDNLGAWEVGKSGGTWLGAGYART